MRIPVTILAVLLAFQANAQTENKITVSGRAWGSVENVSTTGAPGTTLNVSNRFRVTNDSSYVRVRGDLKLSDDLAAWGQVEAQFSFDGSATTPFDSGRNTGAGFTSKTFGTIMAGRWDSPYKNAVIRLDPWGQTTINNYSAVMGQLSQGGNLYDARLANDVQYWSPVISGFQLKLATEVNEDRTPLAAGINPSAFSASLTYDGPVYVGVTYETRKDCSNAGGQGPAVCAGALLATHGRDWGLRAGVGYNNKPTYTEVGFVYEHLESEGDFAAAPLQRTLKRDAYYLSLIQGIGDTGHQAVGGIGLAAKASGNYLPNTATGTNDKTGALYYTLAYRYNFNKDLMVYGAFVQIRNDTNATYRFGASGFTGASPNPTGANYNGWSIGTRYLF